MILARNNDYALELPPQNIEAEEAVLGAILLDPDALAIVKPVLFPEVFSQRIYQIIYKAICEVADKNRKPDLMTVSTHLIEKKLLSEVGGQPRLVMLLERTVSSFNIHQHAQLILEKYYRRQVKDSGYKLLKLAHEESYDEIVEEAEAIFKRIIEPRYLNQRQDLLARIQRVSEIESPTEQWFQWHKLSKQTGFPKKSLIQLAMASEADKGLEYYSAKEFAKLQLVEDQYLVEGLLKYGTLAMLSAEAKTGKSLWHYNLAWHIATGSSWGEFLIKQPTKTLIVQTDETRTELQERLILRGLSELDNVEVMPSFSPYQMRRLARKIKEEGFKFIVLDSLTSINRYSGISQNDDEYGNFGYDLANMASELGCCILLIHHTNKCPVEYGLDKVAGNSSIVRSPSDIFLLSRSKAQGEDTIRILSHLASRSANRQNWKLLLNPEDGSYECLGLCSLEGEIEEGEQDGGGADYKTKIQLFLEANAPIAYEVSEIAHHLNLKVERTRSVCGKLIMSRRIARRKSSVNSRAWAYFFPQVIAEGKNEVGDHFAITSRNGDEAKDTAPSDRLIAKNSKKNIFENSPEIFSRQTGDHTITSTQTIDSESNTASDREVIAEGKKTTNDHLDCDNSLQEISNTSLQSDIDDYVSLLKDAVVFEWDRETTLALVEGIDQGIKEEVWMSLTLAERERIKQIIKEPQPVISSPHVDPKVNDHIEQQLNGEWETCGIIHKIIHRGRHASKYLVAWRSGRTSEHTLEEIYGLGWRVYQPYSNKEKQHLKALPKMADKQKKYLEKEWLSQGYIVVNWLKVDGSKALKFELQRDLLIPDSESDQKFINQLHKVWITAQSGGRIELNTEKFYGAGA